MAMWIKAHAMGLPFGGKDCTTLEGDEPMLNPFTAGRREYREWSSTDASPKGKGVSGGLVMLAAAPVMQISQRVHLTCPDLKICFT